MASIRLSQLQQQILRCLVADHQRTRGLIASSHQALVRALHKDQGNLSHSLPTLAPHGWLVMGRSPGGHAESVILTAAGHQRAAQLPGSCDEETSASVTRGCRSPYQTPSSFNCDAGQLETTADGLRETVS